MKTKRTLLICGLLYLFTGIKAQISFVDVLKTNDTYGTFSFSKATFGDYFFSGLYGNDSGYRIYCARLNDDGKPVWEKSFNPKVLGPNSSNNGYVASAATSDNGIILFTRNTAREGLLIKCNALGKVQWSKKFTIEDSTLIKHYAYIEPIDIIEDAKGNYVLLYQLSTYSFEDNEQIRVLKFDKSGNLLLQTGAKNVVYPGGQYLHVNKIIETNEGGFLIAFTYQTDAFGESPWRQFLIATNPEGDIISYKQAPYEKSYWDQQFILSLFKKENQYYSFGTFHNGTTRRNYYYVSSFNDKGNHLKTELVSYNYFALQQYAKENKLEFNFYNTFINKQAILSLAYAPLHNPPIKKVTITKYDSAGRNCADTAIKYNYKTSSLSFRYGPPLTAERAQDSLIVADAGITSYNVNIMQVNCSLQHAESINNLIATTPKKFAISVLPNPAKNIINISLQAAASSAAAITITDVYGRVWQSCNWSVTNGINYKTQDVSSLRSGLYILRVSNGTNSESIKFIKE